jgi:hypothetical protein
MKRLVAVALLISAVLWAVPSVYAGVPGKSTFEVGTVIQERISNSSFTLTYRASERVGLQVSYQTLGVDGFPVTATGLSLAGAYYLAPPDAQTEPYVFIRNSSITVRFPGGQASASLTGLGVGVNRWLTDSLKFRAVTQLTSGTPYALALSYDVTPSTYVEVGVTGSQTFSSNLTLGVGVRF